MSIAVVNSYLKEHRSDWAVQSVPPSGHVPAEMTVASADDRSHAFSIIVASNRKDDAVKALKADFGVDVSEGFNRFTPRQDGNTLINLTFSEESVISRKLAPPTLGSRQR